MTVEEISNIVNSIEEKVNEVKAIMTDMNACTSEKSKTILLAAASKLASALTGTTFQTR